MVKQTHNRNSERGNVLFLILIAVALFAALSYAVTKSTRSGGGSTEREKAILSGASMTQHPTAMRTAIIRMILGGTDVSAILFNEPANIGAPSRNESVFHPNGGGAVYQKAAPDLMAGASEGDWFYNGNFDVVNLGVDGIGGNELTAFLPGISRAVCTQVNKEFAISAEDNGCTRTDGSNPDLAAALTETDIDELMDESYTFPSSTNQDDLAGEACTLPVFDGKPSGCFYDTDTVPNRYVFYSVLLER